MNLHLKPDVRLYGLRPEMTLAAMIVNDAFTAIGASCRISSGMEGDHSRGSEHYVGNALDFTIKTVPLAERQGLVNNITARLGPDFDVLWEARGTANEHIHVEFDPKLPY